jgi:tryptophanyl-tRNA synthetase
MKATTDSLREIRFDESRPGIYNLLAIYQGFTGLLEAEIEAKYEGKGYGDLKKDLGEVVIEGLRPVRERYRELTADAGYIDSVFKAGLEKARPMAGKKLAEVQKVIGLG